MREVKSRKVGNPRIILSFAMLLFGIVVYVLAGFVGAETPEVETQPREVTYAIFNGRSAVCAGTAVGVSSTSLYILTAAHCVSKPETSRLSVLLGNATFSKQAEFVDYVIIHPYYKPPSLNYDVALLKLRLAQTPDENAQPKFVKLTKVAPNSKDPADVVSWNMKLQPDNITMASASLEDQKSCQAKLGSNIKISSKMLCANVNSAAVPGGSALVFNGGIVGVASYSRNHTQPVVFTNIANSEIYTFVEKHL